MGIRVLFVALLAFVSLANAAEEPLPSSFVNGSAEGYSIALVSASPAPGTIMGVGQTVKFKITVSYQLSVADKGSVLLVVQDETNKNLLGDRKQQSQSVKRGKGTVTLTDSFVVPAGSNEVLLFMPLVPSGISHTSGELVMRYPVKPVVQPVGPTTESVRELLSLIKFDATTADVIARIKSYAKAEIDTRVARETFNPAQTTLIAEYEAKIWSLFDAEVGWPRLESIAVAVFRDSYSPENVDALTVFYRSDVGRAVVAKLPNVTSVLTPERITEWDSIRKSQGEQAAEDKIKEEIGVVFRPSEVDGFCEFFSSTTGKDIMARSPTAIKQFNERWLDLIDGLEVRLRVVAGEYQARIDAARSVK
jgi:hypothetical protein